MATTVFSTWKDSFALDNKPAKWTYDMGVILKGMEGLWYKTSDAKYFNYIQSQTDFFISEDGSIKNYKPDEFNIDNVNNGKLLLLLYRVTGNEKYWKAATILREQLKHQPRTKEGGFWHKKIYPNQMWLDGLYMAEPFYAEYASLADDGQAFDDIANQFIWMEQHARDEKTGLLYHAWDESKEQKWADKTTGRSPHVWARAMGWYADALVDALDYFPVNHPKRKILIDILNRLIIAIEKVQNKQTGLWLDILDEPKKKQNYFEASASCQFVYAIAKAVRKNYIPSAKIAIAKKGYDGIVQKFIKEENGQINLYGTVKVSGLGGNPYRDGSFEYYMSEPVIKNDPKGIGAFLLASNEMELLSTLNKAKGKTVLLDSYFNSEKKKDINGVEKDWHYKWDEKDNGGFSFLGNVFHDHGIKTETLYTAPTTENLKAADIYIIVDADNLADNPHPNYVQAKDAEAIYNWVKSGGVLILLHNDKGNAEFEHFNQLPEKFGIHFNEDSRNHVDGKKFEMGALLINDKNEIFKTARKIYLKEISTLKLSAPAKAVYVDHNDVIMAVSKVGKGTVFAVGDPWLYNEYVDGRRLTTDYDNLKAATDLVNWMIAQIPVKK
ncbi:unsaturated rhamnogalacturonyl hydrolase YteR [mine drainage metagenome]|uniref:Unsaturated rhamnogalacturonyl hydrolase YteR n=1 Tax=mine drainage metagenome TaxID=410659 RepID=A0A1J5SJ26_9ZZZZ